MLARGRLPPAGRAEEPSESLPDPQGRAGKGSGEQRLKHSPSWSLLCHGPGQRPPHHPVDSTACPWLLFADKVLKKFARDDPFGPFAASFLSFHPSLPSAHSPRCCHKYFRATRWAQGVGECFVPFSHRGWVYGAAGSL